MKAGPRKVPEAAPSQAHKAKRQPPASKKRLAPRRHGDQRCSGSHAPAAFQPSHGRTSQRLGYGCHSRAFSPVPHAGPAIRPLSVPKRTKFHPAIPRFAPAPSPAFLSPSLSLSISPCFYKTSLLPSFFRNCMGVQTLPQSCLEKKTVVRSRSPRAFSPPLF